MVSDVLPFLLFETQNVEKRIQQGLEVLPVAPVGCQPDLNCCTGLGDQTFAINLEHFGGLLRDEVLLVEFGGDLL